MRDDGHRAPLWVLVALLALVAVNGIGAAAVVRDAPLYRMSGLSVPFPVSLALAFSGAWALIFAALMIGQTARQAWAFRAFAPLITLYALLRLALLVFLARSDYDSGREGFQVLVTLIVLAPFWFVSLRRGWLLRPQRQ